MYLLYCDETNFTKVSGDFFVYGGIAIGSAVAAELASDIDRLRSDLKVPKDYILKFNPGPAGFSHEQFIALKKGVIQAAAKHNCILLINLLLHDIASSSEEARRNGINTLAFHFDCFLNRFKVPGLMMIDRFHDKKIDEQLKEKLAVGITGSLPFSESLKLKHIVGYHLSSVGQSHFCSLVDVILGSLRFAMNAFTQKSAEHQKSATEILMQLAPLFYRESGEFQAQALVHPISLWFSPKDVRSPGYQAQYAALKGYLSTNGIEAAQGV
jgi:hypothetical protein